MNACKNATSNSIIYMKTVNAIEKGEVPQPAPEFSLPTMNMSEIKQMMIMCPATIFAKRRIINAKGLINTLKKLHRNQNKLNT